MSVTDHARKIVFTRLGERLRVAGTAELNGYNTEIDAGNMASILPPMLRSADLLAMVPPSRHAGVLDADYDWMSLPKLLARIRQFDFGAKDVDQMVVTWPVDFLPWRLGAVYYSAAARARSFNQSTPPVF